MGKLFARKFFDRNAPVHARDMTFVAYCGQSGEHAAWTGLERLSPVVIGQFLEIITRLAELAETAAGEWDAIRERHYRQLSAIDDTPVARG